MGKTDSLAMEGIGRPPRDFSSVLRNVPHRKTLSFCLLSMAFIAGIAFDSLFVRTNDQFGTPIALIAMASLGAAFMLSRFDLRYVGQLTMGNWPLHLFSLSFLIVCVAFHGGYRLGSVATYTVVAYATYAIVPYLLATDQNLFEAFVKLVAISSALLAIPSFFGALGHETFLGLPLHLKLHYADLSGIIASGGIFEHGEGHALQMAAGVLCSLYVLRSSRSGLYFVCLALAALGLLVSQGRAAMLGLVVAFCVRVLPGFVRRSPFMFLATLAVCLIFPFVIWTQLEHIPGLASYLRLERGLSGRTEAWEYARSLIEERPWTGYGFLASSELTELHSEWLLRMGFTGVGTTFHNTFISKMVDLGIIVTAFYALLYLVPLVRICRPSDSVAEQHLVRSMVLLTLVTAIFRDYNIGGVRSTVMIGAAFLGVANLWQIRTIRPVGGHGDAPRQGTIDPLTANLLSDATWPLGRRSS